MNYDYLNGKNPNCNAKVLKMLYWYDVHGTPRCRAIEFLISETKVPKPFGVAVASLTLQFAARGSPPGWNKLL